MSARLVLSLALLGAALAGCGAPPFEYHSQREIPKGPGLFSGEEGVFALGAARVRGLAGMARVEKTPARLNSLELDQRMRRF